MTPHRFIQRSLVLSILPTLGFFAPGAAAQVVIDVDQLRQRIDGFGASSAFFSKDISEDDAEWLFSPDLGIGVSMLRVRIHHEDAITEELETAKKAVAYGVPVWAAPWTPPPRFKSNAGTADELKNKNGATLTPANYGAFAEYLADFVENMADEGVEIVAITPQNEPDYMADWDGCSYSPQQMASFIGSHLGPEFEERGLSTQIVAPDTAFLKNLPSFGSAFMADANVKKYLAGFSTHPYESDGFDPSWSVPRDNGLFFWQTELSWEDKSGAGDRPDFDTEAEGGMKTALWMTKIMHDHLTVMWVNAWNYWNLTAVNDDYSSDSMRKNPALIQDGKRLKRGYAFGNYSKFVRPGFHRVDASPDKPVNNVLVSAYLGDAENPEQGQLVVVAINDNNAVSNQTFTIEGELPFPIKGKPVPYVTSATYALAAQPEIEIDPLDNSFDFALPAKSVTSFVVQLDVTAPNNGSGGADSTGSGGDGAGASANGAGGDAALAGGSDGLGAGGVSVDGSGGALAAGGGDGLASGGLDGATAGSGASTGAPGGESDLGIDEAGCGCDLASSRSKGLGAMWGGALVIAALARLRRRPRPGRPPHRALT